MCVCVYSHCRNSFLVRGSGAWMLSMSISLTVIGQRGDRLRIRLDRRGMSAYQDLYVDIFETEHVCVCVEEKRVLKRLKVCVCVCVEV